MYFFSFFSINKIKFFLRYPWIKSLFTNDYDLGVVHNWIDFFGGWQKSSPICSQKDFIV